MNLKIGIALAVLAFTGVALASCGDDDGGAGFDLIKADVARAEGNSADAIPAAQAGADLGFDILGAMGDQDSNRAISPYSIQVALAMTRNGARGQTRAEMDSVLGVQDPGGAAYDESMNALDQLLLSRAGDYDIGDGKKVTLELSTANALWGPTRRHVRAAVPR